jgi:hypothetical protein
MLPNGNLEPSFVPSWLDNLPTSFDHDPCVYLTNNRFPASEVSTTARVATLRQARIKAAILHERKVIMTREVHDEGVKVNNRNNFFSQNLNQH